ncbi:small multi-drug export protein [Desulfospira joergensenii]|uniref:small multi-drug export protein n=1 Tax=Desulfospira joergensenii TaxID=53329 RepID=UPI0003B3AA8E|nr:small multi-drug export protein [Desulfospira joergensenii]
MKRNLWTTAEGKIFLLGLLLSLALLAYIGFYATTDLEIAKILALALLAHTFGGRAAGIGLCILNGFGPVLTIAYNFYLEVLIVCFTYSGFVLTTTNYLRIEWITRFMDRLAEKAWEKKEKMKSYGWIGIFLFVMAPLPVTGPVVGSIIGYMIRLSLVRNFSATFLGTLTAIIIWFFCFDFLEQRFHMIQYVFAGIVIIVLIPYLKKIKDFIKGLSKSKPE